MTDARKSRAHPQAPRPAPPDEPAEVVHVMDRFCAPEALEEASLLAGPDDRMICFGALPEAWPAGLDRRRVRSFGQSELEFHPAGVLRALPRGSFAYQCWSVHAAWDVEMFLSARPAPALLRLPGPPGESETRQLLALAGRGKLGVACPSEFVAEALARMDLPAEARVIPPAADTRRADAALGQRSRLRQQLGIAEGQAAIVAPGPVHRRSGIFYDPVDN